MTSALLSMLMGFAAALAADPATPAANAATPTADLPEAAAGFRIHPAESQRSASVRIVAVPGTATVFQQVPRIRIGTPRVSADLQLAVVQVIAPSLDWSQVAVGRAVLGGRVHLGEQRRQAIALEVDGGIGAPGAWGSHSIETLPGFGVRVAWEGTWTPGGRHTLTGRAGGGLLFVRSRDSVVPFSADTALAWVIPIGDSSAFMGILEVETQLNDAIPVSGRLLVRWNPVPGKWSTDVGLQQSGTYDGDVPAVGLVAQVRTRF